MLSLSLSLVGIGIRGNAKEPNKLHAFYSKKIKMGSRKNFSRQLGIIEENPIKSSLDPFHFFPSRFPVFAVCPLNMILNNRFSICKVVSPPHSKVTKALFFTTSDSPSKKEKRKMGAKHEFNPN